MNDPLTREEQVRLTQNGFRLLALWDIPKHLHPRLLGLDESLPKRKLNRYRLGTPLPTEGDCYRRITLLLSIDAILHKLFPHSELSANLWVTTPNVRFGGALPLDTMLNGGLEGIQRVERSLHAPHEWH
jgi:hypothetical protein